MGCLEGKVALVTGASQGIGLGIAAAMAAQGAQLLLADLKREEGEQAASKLGRGRGNAQFHPTDVAQSADVQEAVQHAVDAFGRLDIVINNAGICLVRDVESCTVEEWDRVMNVNVRSIFLTTKYALPHLRQHSGSSIVSVASISSFVGQQGTPAYTASKGAVHLLTKSLAVDLGPDQIRVNCICPGITDTPMLRSHIGHAANPERHLQERLNRVPLGQMLYPQDIGEAAVFLASDAARGISGASLVIDGGYIACAEFQPANEPSEN